MKSDQGGQEVRTVYWEDRLGAGLAIVAAFLALALVATNVYMVSTKNADTATTLLLNALSLVFSTVCTVWVGRWSALRENKAFIRAALRTTYGLQEGLEAAEQTALDGINRMRTRPKLDLDMSTQLWEETTGRVVDQIRALVRRAQETVANWKEFGPEEVEALTTAEIAKASAVTDLSGAAAQMRSMLESFGPTLAPAQTAKLQERIEALEQEREKIYASSVLAFPTTGEARRLLALGAFNDAIDAYSSLIAVQPEGHTLYIGRARAKYMKGDRTGALADLDEAERLCPNDDAIQRMRVDIQLGRQPDNVSVRIEQPWKDKVEKANAEMARGRAEEALVQFEEAEQLGLNPVFAGENIAMALALAGRTAEARQRLRNLEPLLQGSFVRVQARLIYTICDALDGTEVTSQLQALRKDAKELAYTGAMFQVSRSPIQYLLSGLVKLEKSLDVINLAVAAAQGEVVFTVAPE